VVRVPGAIITLALLALLIMPSLASRRSIASATADYGSQDFQDSATLSLTYTSRWSPSPQPLEPGSFAVGDHVQLSASVETLPGEPEVTMTRMELYRGFFFETTQPLVDPGNEGISELPPDPISELDLAWVAVSGLSVGDNLRVLGDYTNGDTDFFAWSADTPFEERTIANNVLGTSMAGDSHPEAGTFTWWSRNDTIIVGVLNYDGDPGNFTLIVDTREDIEIEDGGNTVSFDTYGFFMRNQTTDVYVYGETSTGAVHEFEVQNLTICNYFSPHMAVAAMPIAPWTFNISWTSWDLNEDDVNFYSVWALDEDSGTVHLLSENLTQSWYVWNSSLLIPAEYRVRVRAYSTDFQWRKEIAPGAYWPDDVAVGPSTYWPGDYSEDTSPPFHAAAVEYAPLFLSSPPDVAFEHGATGQEIVWYVSFGEGYVPSSAHYTLLVNREIVEQTQLLLAPPQEFRHSLADYEIGTYQITLRLVNIDTEEEYAEDTVIVTVRAASPDLLTRLTLYGIDVAAAVVIVASVAAIYSERRKRPSP
jgi:hypothetical protein